MNNDLISRSALLASAEKSGVMLSSSANPSDEEVGAHKVIYAIVSAPAVDAVPVVRCGECQYYENGECECPYIFMSDGAHLYPEADDFCKYGERRTDK